MTLFKHFFNNDLAISSYLVGDKVTKQCVVIDPSRDIEPITTFIKAEKLKLVAILETHVHADFISGAYELKSHFGGNLLIYTSGYDPNWMPAYSDKEVHEDVIIFLGNAYLKALHTPGHTPEHLVWLYYDKNRSSEIPWFMFTGDLIFVGSIGRPDLLGAKELQCLSLSLYNTLFEGLKSIPDFVEVYPSHGAGSLCGKEISSRFQSTIGYERLFNPGLRKLPFDEWFEKLKVGMPSAPLAYPKIKEMNLKIPKLYKELFLEAKHMTPQEVKETQNLLVIDMRNPDEFAKKHFPGSINIPIKGAFISWMEMVFTPDVDYILILPDLQVLEPLKMRLALIGMEKMKGYILVEEMKDEFSESFPFLPPAEIGKRMVIDVRTPPEWHAGHIESAKNIELPNLQKVINEVPKETPLAVICGSGYRASVAASIFKKAGFKDVANMQGGMQLWRDKGMPIVD